MSRLKQEFSVIPRTGIVIAVLVAGGLLAIILALGEGPAIAQIAMGVIVPSLFVIYILLVSYVYGDAKRRGMRPVLWMLIAAFVQGGIGFIIYFLIREPQLQPCPSCNTLLRREFAFCPQCGTSLPRVCPSCTRPVEPVWPHCAHCGTRLTGTEAPEERLVPQAGSDELAPSPD